ncbi:hypothetical protein [Fischerella sp. PCC 9605]|uniref:hypothetical protein n=1 Tax=Fischerella sp. PCC 9605 TaxID=1173024 RepID=UPI00047EAFEA|nr:hypothetical protein [Fischerella sp. PCC 9605]
MKKLADSLSVSFILLAGILGLVQPATSYQFFGDYNLRSPLEKINACLGNDNIVKALTVVCTGTSRQHFSSSSDYQESAITLRAVNLRKPHILKINTSGSQLQGKITFNSKVIKQIRNKRVYIDLSRYLSVGKHVVEISARYSPASSSVNVEFSGPGVKTTQQTSGSGILNYTLNVSVY